MWSRTREVRYLMTFYISLLYYELKQKKVEVAQSYHNSVDICAVAHNLVCGCNKGRSPTHCHKCYRYQGSKISLLYSYYGCINTTDKMLYQARNWPTSAPHRRIQREKICMSVCIILYLQLHLMHMTTLYRNNYNFGQNATIGLLAPN